MRTLYLRNVPDEVVERLEERARAESISVNTLAVRELVEVSRRFDNRALFAALPKLTSRARKSSRVCARSAGNDRRRCVRHL